MARTKGSGNGPRKKRANRKPKVGETKSAQTDEASKDALPSLHNAAQQNNIAEPSTSLEQVVAPNYGITSQKTAPKRKQATAEDRTRPEPMMTRSKKRKMSPSPPAEDSTSSGGTPSNKNDDASVNLGVGEQSELIPEDNGCDEFASGTIADDAPELVDVEGDAGWKSDAVELQDREDVGRTSLAIDNAIDSANIYTQSLRKAVHDSLEDDQGFPIDDLLMPENEFVTKDPPLVLHSPPKPSTHHASLNHLGHPRIAVLRKLIEGLPHQLAKASEFDFSFSNIQPTEEDLDTYSLSGVYHNVLASIFGPRSSLQKMSHEDRLGVYAVSTHPHVAGGPSPIQEATQLDGSVLWGRGVNASKIADDFDAALAQLPGDGPLLKWVENVIDMARHAYALFHKPIPSHFGVSRPNPPAPPTSPKYPLKPRPSSPSPFTSKMPGHILSQSSTVAGSASSEAPNRTLRPRSNIPNDLFDKDIGIHLIPTKVPSVMRQVDEMGQIVESEAEADTDDLYDPGNNAGTQYDPSADASDDPDRTIGLSMLGSKRNGKQTRRNHKSLVMIESQDEIADTVTLNGNTAVGPEPILSGRPFTQAEKEEIYAVEEDLDFIISRLAERMHISESRIWEEVALRSKSERAPSAWSGFQMYYRDHFMKRPPDQKIQSWTKEVVAPAYHAKRAGLGPEELDTFEKEMIQYHEEHSADRDVSKVEEGKRAHIMARDAKVYNRKSLYYQRLGIIFTGYFLSADPADGRAITQNTFFGPPHVARALVGKHSDMAGHLADVVHDVYKESRKGRPLNWSAEERDRLRGTKSASRDAAKTLFSRFLRSKLPENFIADTQIYVGLTKMLLKQRKRILGWPTILNKILKGADWANSISVHEAQQLLDFLWVERNRDEFLVEDWSEANIDQDGHQDITLIIDSDRNPVIVASDVSQWEKVLRPMSKRNKHHVSSSKATSLSSKSAPTSNTQNSARSSSRAASNEEVQRKKKIISSLNKLDREYGIIRQPLPFALASSVSNASTSSRSNSQFRSLSPEIDFMLHDTAEHLDAIDDQHGFVGRSEHVSHSYATSTERQQPLPQSMGTLQSHPQSATPPSQSTNAHTQQQQPSQSKAMAPRSQPPPVPPRPQFPRIADVYQEQRLPPPLPRVANAHQDQRLPTPVPRIADIYQDQRLPPSLPRVANAHQDQRLPTPVPRIADIYQDQHLPPSLPRVANAHQDQRLPTPVPRIADIYQDQRLLPPLPRVANAHQDQHLPTPAPQIADVYQDQRLPPPLPRVTNAHQDQRLPIPLPQSMNAPFQERRPPPPLPRPTNMQLQSLPLPLEGYYQPSLSQAQHQLSLQTADARYHAATQYSDGGPSAGQLRPWGVEYLSDPSGIFQSTVQDNGF